MVNAWNEWPKKDDNDKQYLDIVNAEYLVIVFQWSVGGSGWCDRDMRAVEREGMFPATVIWVEATVCEVRLMLTWSSIHTFTSDQLYLSLLNKGTYLTKHGVTTESLMGWFPVQHYMNRLPSGIQVHLFPLMSSVIVYCFYYLICF